MKKILFAAIALVAMLSVSSCKTDQCKCTITTIIGGNKTVTEEIINRPEDDRCSELEADDFVKLGENHIDYKCKNYHE